LAVTKTIDTGTNGLWFEVFYGAGPALNEVCYIDDVKIVCLDDDHNMGFRRIKEYDNNLIF